MTQTSVPGLIPSFLAKDVPEYPAGSAGASMAPPFFARGVLSWNLVQEMAEP